jgi:GTP-binding protein
VGKIRTVELFKTVYRPGERFPEARNGDIAFVGRSNVGKSTLLNILFGRKLAHVSKRPGKTRSINF